MEIMSNHTAKTFLWFTILVIVMACVPPFSAAPPIPTLDSKAINTYIAQTADVASTQTFVALSTSTPTTTFTSTPRSTNTPEPTATNTVIWIVKSPTNPVSASLTALAITSNEKYACLLISVEPGNWTSFPPRKNFEATWRVKNIGKKVWDKDDTDFIYSSGDKFYKESGYDFAKTAEPGTIGELTVAMQSPKKPGNYTTTWAIRIGSVEFCKLILSIIVK